DGEPEEQRGAGEDGDEGGDGSEARWPGEGAEGFGGEAHEEDEADGGGVEHARVGRAVGADEVDGHEGEDERRGCEGGEREGADDVAVGGVVAALFVR